MKNIVIVGGGIAGLAAAGLLVRQRKKNIIIVESADRVGGLLKSFSYEKQGQFDHGTHYLANIYGKEINELFISCLPKNEWSILNGLNSDISGVYFNQSLQKNTVFADFRSFNPAQYKKYIGELFAHLNDTPDTKNTTENTAKSYLEKLYGQTIAKEVFEPILNNIFGLSSSKLHEIAAKLIPLHRICLFNTPIANEILNTTILNSIHAYPSQLDLPDHLAPNYFSYYPKRRGMQTMIDSLESYLLNSGVQILTNTKIVEAMVKNKVVQSLRLDNGSELPVSKFISALPLVGLSKLMGIYIGDTLSQMDKPKHTVITNIILNKVNDLNGRQYIYCYDSSLKTFRITNYNALTNANEIKPPITVESLHDEIPSKEQINKIIISELYLMKIINSHDDVQFIETEILAYGFPCLSINNIVGLDKLRNQISNLRITNMTKIGALNENNIFFMKDVLLDVTKKIGALHTTI